MQNVPRHLDEPPLDIPILQWWASDYDFVYVILNPFFKVPGYSPATTKYGVQHVGKCAVPDIVKYVQENSVRGPNDAPDDFDSTIKRIGQKVSWSEIQQATGTADFMEFARTVWLWVLQSERADKNAAIAEALTIYCQKNHVYPPEEDMLPAVLEPTLSEYLKRLGIGEVTIWNEWRNKSLKVPAIAFEPANQSVEIPGEKLSAIAGDGLLLSWSFDDVAGLLCLSEELHSKFNPLKLFEGFAVTPAMYADVFNPVDFFERNPLSEPS